MSFLFSLPPVPRLPPDLSALETWLQDARTRIVAWANKERSLGAYMAYDSQDRKTIDLATLSTALAPVMNSLLNHSLLSNLTADDHQQYISIQPDNDARNEIHPGPTVKALTLFCESNDLANILELWDSTGTSVQSHFDYKGTYVDD